MFSVTNATSPNETFGYGPGVVHKGRVLFAKALRSSSPTPISERQIMGEQKFTRKPVIRLQEIPLAPLYLTVTGSKPPPFQLRMFRVNYDLDTGWPFRARF